MFTPVVPIGGYGGWRFLNRTMEAQKSAFAESLAQKRDMEYFRQKIGSVRTAEQLVSDRRLLSVALGAFGLEDDLGSRAFIRKVLEDGTLKPVALANRLSDKRYLELSKTFGFGDFAVPRTQLSDFADKLLARYRDQRFEAAIGLQSDSMRLALNARRELPALARRSMSEDAKWLTGMGTPPLRKVFEGALGLPASFAAIDIDQQLGVLQDRASRFLGSAGFSAFADPSRVEEVIRLYLVRGETASAGASGGGSAALQILGTIRRV